MIALCYKQPWNPGGAIQTFKMITGPCLEKEILHCTLINSKFNPDFIATNCLIELHLHRFYHFTLWAKERESSISPLKKLLALWCLNEAGSHFRVTHLKT